jgi:hypothetical protein
VKKLELIFYIKILNKVVSLHHLLSFTHRLRRLRRHRHRRLRRHHTLLRF